MKKIIFGMVLAVLGMVLAIVISGCASNTLEQCPNKQELKAKITKARERIQRFQKGHVVVGRVVLDGDGEARYVMSQMDILPEGYFAGPIKDLARPVGFRMHQYAPYDLQLTGVKKDKNKDLFDVGTIHMKPLKKDKLSDLKAHVVLEDGVNPLQARIFLRIDHGPVNTPSGGTLSRKYWPEPIKIPVQGNGSADASGFSPIEYSCRVRALGYLDKSFKIEFKEGQTLDLGTITLEKPRQIELAYIVSKEPPFDLNDLKTVRIPAGTRWKPVDDIRSWDLEFKQEKGSILMKSFYRPSYLQDLGSGEIEEYVNIDKSILGQKLPHDQWASNKHVYLFHQERRKRWVLFKIIIEDGLEIEKPSVEPVEALVKAQVIEEAEEEEKEQKEEEKIKVSVKGQVTNEEGKPLGGVSWWISAIEEWKDGHWIVVHSLGYTLKNVTDDNGRFVLTFPENVRYDLQFFDKGGYGPTFLYQVSRETLLINVVMKKGIPIRGTVHRLVNGKRESVFGSGVVELRLPNSRGNWYSKQAFLGYDGEFVCFASVPPQPPMEFALSANGKPHPYRSQTAKWQVVFAGEIVQIDVEEGKHIDDIHFEVEVEVSRGKIQQPEQSDNK